MTKQKIKKLEKEINGLILENETLQERLRDLVKDFQDTQMREIYEKDLKSVEEKKVKILSQKVIELILKHERL